MKIIKILSLICFLTICAFGQNGDHYVEGIVTDPDGRPVNGAEVTLENEQEKQTVKTDDKGRYRIVVVSIGRYILTAAHSANGQKYISEPVEITVFLNQTIRKNLQLTKISTIRGEVTVIASGTTQVDSEISKTVNIIEGREMRERADFALTDTLRTVPGFRVQQLGGFGRTASIKTRGLRNQDTAVLIDGVRFRDVSTITGDASAFLSFGHVILLGR